MNAIDNAIARANMPDLARAIAFAPMQAVARARQQTSEGEISPAPTAEKPKPDPRPQLPGDPCWACGTPDAYFNVGDKYFCCRSCAYDYCC